MDRPRPLAHAAQKTDDYRASCAVSRPESPVKPALHRSITFWSGIMVITFLCWAWRDSFRHKAEVGKGRWLAASDMGGVVIYAFNMKMWGFHVNYDEKDPRAYAGWSAFQPLCRVSRTELEGLEDHWRENVSSARNARELFPARMMDYWATSEWLIFIPYWLILSAFTIPWGVLLLMRARRRKRAGTHPE